MRRLLAALQMLWLLMISSPALAAVSQKKEATIHINHKDEQYTIESWDSKGKTSIGPRSLKKGLSVTLKPGETVLVVVDDPNPFLYSYSLTAGKETPTANGEAALQFVSQLRALMNTIDPPKRTSLRHAVPSSRGYLGQPMLASFRSDMQTPTDPSPPLPVTPTEIAIDNAVDSLNSTTKATEALPSNETISIQNYVKQKSDILNNALISVRANPVPLPNSQSDVIRDVLRAAEIEAGPFLRNFRERILKLVLFSSDTPNLIKTVDQGNIQLATASVEVWDIERLEKDLNEDFEKFHKVGQEFGSRLNVEEDVRQLSEIRALAGRVEREEESISKDCRDRVNRGVNGLTACLLEVAIRDKEKDIERMISARNNLKPQKPSDLDDRDAIDRKINELSKQLGILRGYSVDLVKLEKLKNNLARDPFYLSLGFLLPYEQVTRSSIKELKGFSVSMKRAAKPQDVGTVTYSTLKRGDSLGVKLVENPPVKAARAITDYALEFEPHSSFDVRVGGAILYSFVEKRAFAATPSEGKFKIQETKNEYTGVNIAAMLTIAPTAWTESDYHGLFEIGVKPDTNVGLYGGVAFAFSDLFSVGVGVAFEQVDELKEGLAVGGIIDASDQLKTQKRFTPGFYLHFTISSKLNGGKK